MYGIIRMLISVGAVIAVGILLRKSRIKNKRRAYIISFCLAMVLWVGLEFVPFENLFVTFDSPEASYKYQYMSKLKDPIIISGDHSDMLIQRSGSESNFSLIPKTEKGWKLGRPLEMKWTVYTYDNGVTVDLFRYRDTDDYYVIIYKADGAEIELSADDVEFSSSKRDMAYPETEYNNYYAHVNELGYITVDDMRIKLGEIGEHVIDAVQFGL